MTSANRRVGILIVAITAALTSAGSVTWSPARGQQMQARSQRERIDKSVAVKTLLSSYPDRPVSQQPDEPLTTKFVVEHRSALNGERVSVKGIVVAMVNRSSSPTQTGALPPANANPQPRIFLAANDRKERDKNYDLLVLLPEGESKYSVGETVTVSGVVEGSRHAVILRITN